MQACATRGGSGDQEGAEQQIREWGGHRGDPHLSRWFPTTTSFSSTMLGCWSCRSRVISRRLLTGIPAGSNCHCLEQGPGRSCPPQEPPPLLHYHPSRCPSAPSSTPRFHLSGCPGPGLEEQHRPRAQDQKTNAVFIVTPPLSPSVPQPHALPVSRCGQMGCGPLSPPPESHMAALTHDSVGSLSDPVQLLELLNAPASSQLEANGRSEAALGRPSALCHRDTPPPRVTGVHPPHRADPALKDQTGVLEAPPGAASGAEAAPPALGRAPRGAPWPGCPRLRRHRTLPGAAALSPGPGPTPSPGPEASATLFQLPPGPRSPCRLPAPRRTRLPAGAGAAAAAALRPGRSPPWWPRAASHAP